MFRIFEFKKYNTLLESKPNKSFSSTLYLAQNFKIVFSDQQHDSFHYKLFSRKSLSYIEPNSVLDKSCKF